MSIKRISTESPFEKEAGYSRALVKGNWCFVSGTTGYDYEKMTMPDSVEEQTQNALIAIDKILAEAGFKCEDIVRVQYTITDAAYADSIFPTLSAYFKDNRPAATMVVAGLIKEEMKIEIEATAFRES